VVCERGAGMGAVAEGVSGYLGGGAYAHWGVFGGQRACGWWWNKMIIRPSPYRTFRLSVLRIIGTDSM